MKKRCATRSDNNRTTIEESADIIQVVSIHSLSQSIALKASWYERRPVKYERPDSPLWLLFFGEVFARARVLLTGSIPYLDFVAPGILAQSVLFVAIFYGIAIIWERDLGIVQKFLASPAPRAALVLGKALSAGVRALSQAFVVYALAFLLGVRLNWNPVGLLGMLATITL